MDIRRVRRLLEHGWVSVDERLPKPNEIVLTFSEYGVVSGKHFEGISWSAEYTDYETGEPWLHGETVTHWMPLPEPPEETCCEAKDTTHEM